VVGYVSADFRHHSAASCFGPVLRRHDHSRFQINLYSGVRVEDDWTQEFRSLADVWRNAAELSDEALARQIQTDGVDILIDLSAHSEGNRLLAFARKPAPVQITAWGHGGGTGLPMIDYQLTDPVFIPPEVRHPFAETCFDLPCCLTFEAPECADAVRPLPAIAAGFVTFGSLNRFSKVSPEVFERWMRILEAMPDSRLLLKDPMLAAIDPARLELRGSTSRQQHLATCHGIDLALDTFPQNGGIATWEALWMGVPVVALLGGSPAGRLSGAILGAVGLGEWAAEDPDAYLELAVRKASDLDALACLRAELRSRILASPAGNPEHYTHAVEEAYRTLWKRWLSGETAGGAKGGAPW